MAKSRIFLFLLLAFIAGVAFRSFVPIPLTLVWIGTMCALALTAAGILRAHKGAIVFGTFLLVFLVGIFRFHYTVAARPDLSTLYGKPFAMRGVVWDEPERARILERMKVKIDAVEGRALGVPFFALVTSRRYPEYRIGDELSIQGALEAPTRIGDFDYPAYLSREDIFSVVSFPLIEKVGEGKGNRVKFVLAKLKRSFEAKIDRALPEPHGAFLKGLLLGERESLPDDLTEAFNRTGTSHIVALSGYNITLVGRFFTAGLLFLTVPYAASFWIAVAGIIGFVILTGASPSVVRAGIMGILVLIAVREGRVYHMANALAFAGAAMLFLNPTILRFDAAFQLSFLATIGLVYLSPVVERFFDRFRPSARFAKNRDRRSERLIDFKATFVETLSAQLAVLPLLVYLFGRVSLVSPLANLLVLIAVPYAMAAGFVTGVAGYVAEPVAQVLGWASWLLLEYILRIVEIFSKIPAAAVEVGKWALIPTALLVLMLFRGVFSHRKSYRHRNSAEYPQPHIGENVRDSR